MNDRVFAGMSCTDVADLAAGFVLGALEPAEMETVRAHLAACPEPHPEFAELGAVIPALLASVEPVEPRAALRDRVMAAARADTTRAVDIVAAASARAPEPARLEERTRRLTFDRVFGFRQPVWAGLGVAAVVAIAVLGASNLQLRSERDQLATYERTVADVMAAVTKPDTQLAVLADSPGGPQANGLAAVSSTGEIRLAINGLTPTAGSQVYEAWYIPNGGAPLPIDGFTVGSTGTGTVSTSWTPPSGSSLGGVVAITLEPGAGATTPTLPIVASGAAG
jgi:anti-sigma factor RsiW